ncbi:LOW QUALITY PROTEIN: mediator of DNA damage checkpoint protein 1-like [Catharus ustulatus]|uniref:LOW QUALITY PROTEIN: mediator of DNA damage checkpoint protein 1-like n=1 Tax=Catharus ustulatus TaxID=91951 RepID=UPI00140E7E5F|nr:LOW QUALITY PROTEIN: mediator of DNA damage checkpoint protein 1-like [Catharus ustulatus]
MDQYGPVKTSVDQYGAVWMDTDQYGPIQTSMDQYGLVLFTGLVASPALLVALGSLGGTEATSVQDCTHLVTDGIRRTLKFLCAMGRGVPIVTPEWLIQSSHGGVPLSPAPFLPRDPPPERRLRFRLSSALERARGHPLLQGYGVHVTPGVQPCPQDMKDIVTCCGGTFLPLPPREHRPDILVISCPQDRALWAPFEAARLPLLSAEFLLSGALRQRLELRPFLLQKTPNSPQKHKKKVKFPSKIQKSPTEKFKFQPQIKKSRWKCPESRAKKFSFTPKIKIF